MKARRVDLVSKFEGGETHPCRLSLSSSDLTLSPSCSGLISDKVTSAHDFLAENGKTIATEPMPCWNARVMKSVVLGVKTSADRLHPAIGHGFEFCFPGASNGEMALKVLHDEGNGRLHGTTV